MSLPILMYVDEDELEIRQFKRSLRGKFKVLKVSFERLSLDDLLIELAKKNYDYLVVDYHLNEMSGCGFNGDEVLDKFLERFPHFPAMLLTNHDEGAIESVKGFDVEKVRSKKEYVQDELKPAFIARIKAKIDQYKQEVKKKELRIQQLTEKRLSEESLSANEEDELIRLDDFIDETLGANAHNVPKEVITSTNDAQLNELLLKTDSLIERLKEYEDVS